MKRIKMCLYGEPGVGKSVFACKAPKPLFICTDNNYGWLEDFGANPNDHVDVSSWSEMKKTLEDKDLLSKYQTIVIDLLEDAFKWCEQEFCSRNRLDHISDINYGKGYDITRNQFFVEISKLLALDVNVILIMHGITTTVKDRRGVEHTKYVPSSRLPDKLLDMIEGRVRYFLRCYVKGEENPDGTVVKTRYLSVVPKENEFGIIRGVDENKIAQDIPLDWNTFVDTIGLKPSDIIGESITSKDETPTESVADKTETEDKPVKRSRALRKQVEEEKPVELVEAKQEDPEPILYSAPELANDADSFDSFKPFVEQTEEPKKELTLAEKKEAIRKKLEAMKAKRQ